MQVFIVDAARQQVGVAFLEAVGGSGLHRLAQQLQCLRVVLLAVVQPRHLVVYFVAIILVLQVFQQASEVLVQPRPVLRAQVRHLRQHQLGLKVELVRWVAGQQLVELLVGLLVFAGLLIQLGQQIARARPLVLVLNQWNGLFELRNGLGRLIGPQVVVGPRQKQLARIFRPALLLIQQVRHRLGAFQLTLCHKRAHQPNQRLVLGVVVLARRVHILKRQRRVVELHHIKPRPAHQHVGVIRPVRPRPVLNRHRRPLDDIVQIGAAGLHAGTVQRRKQRQRLVVVVGPRC